MRPDRILRLLKSRLVENKRKYGFYTLTLWIVLILVLFLFMVNQGSNLVYAYPDPRIGQVIQVGSDYWYLSQAIVWWGAFFLAGTFFAAASFVGFGNPGEGILYVLRPASGTEKWLVESAIHLVLFPLVFALLFYSLMIPATGLMNRNSQKEFEKMLNGRSQIELAQRTPVNGAPSSSQTTTMVTPTRIPHEIFQPFAPQDPENSYTLPAPVTLMILLLAFSLFSFLMLGSVVFNRFAFFKTLITGFVVFVVAVLLYTTVPKLLLPPGWSYSLLSTTAHYSSDTESKMAELPEAYCRWVFPALSFVLLVWLQAVLRLSISRKTV